MGRTIQGTVSSDKADKSIIVTVTGRKTHPVYKKQYSRSTKFIAHDETNEAKIGDTVIIRENRPISRRKRFVLDKIVEKAHAGFVETDATADVPVEEPAEKSERPTMIEKKADSKAPKTNDKDAR